MRRRIVLHCVFAKWGSQSGEYAPGPSNTGEVALSSVIVYVCLALENTISVGCAGGLQRIAHSQNCALKPSSTRRRLQHSLLWRANRTEWHVPGAWRPAEWDAAADCRALRIHKNAPLNR